MKKLPVIAIAGPTASGKSTLALQLARCFDGELICMDSMQIYRRMDIGTAKPTAQEQKLLPHHMLDLVDPEDSFSVSEYAPLAEQTIREVSSRGKLPILVGGTGLYLKAVMHGMTLGSADKNEELRARLNEEALLPDGKARLHERLAKLDPDAAARLHENDLRRVIRAIEICETTGKTTSAQCTEERSSFDVLPLAILWPREELYTRIETRVDQMMDSGLLNEVKALLASGVPADAQSMQAIGYKELIPVILQSKDLKDAIALLKQNTRHYAKRQETWMRTEPKTVWLDAHSSLLHTAGTLVENFLKQERTEIQ